MSLKKYNIIYADPAWQYKRPKLQDGGREPLVLDKTQYKTMSIEDIKALPVKNMTEKDSVCFLWVTDSHLKEGLEVLENWGFTYKTIAFNWIKHYESGETCVNVAPYTLKSWEICLLGIKGHMFKYKKSHNVQGLVNAVRTRHSEKPAEVRDRIRALYGDLPAIELFARTKTEGWDVFGNEVSNSINIEEYRC